MRTLVMVALVACGGGAETSDPLPCSEFNALSYTKAQPTQLCEFESDAFVLGSALVLSDGDWVSAPPAAADGSFWAEAHIWNGDPGHNGVVIPGVEANECQWVRCVEATSVPTCDEAAAAYFASGCGAQQGIPSAHDLASSCRSQQYNQASECPAAFARFLVFMTTATTADCTTSDPEIAECL